MVSDDEALSVNQRGDRNDVINNLLAALLKWDNESVTDSATPALASCEKIFIPAYLTSR